MVAWNVNLNLTEQQKKWARWAGYPLFALFVFIYALHLSLPYERIETMMQDAAGDGFDVRVESAGPGWFPGDVVLKGVSFKSRPAREGDKPVELSIDRLDIDVGVLALIGGKTDVEIEAIIGAGRIEGHVSASKSSAHIDVHSHELPLEQLPGIRTATGGVPMAGGISIDLDVTLPKGKWKDASGKMSIDCEGCTIGDGVAKIRPQAPGQANAFSDGGFTLPKLKLGKIGGKIVIAKGVGSFEEFVGKSPDGELYLDGNIRFEDPFVKSVVTAYMRFKAADQLVTREPKMGDIILMMKGQSLRPEDGLMGLKIIGPFNALRFIGSKISPVPVGGPGGSKDKGGSRPALGGVSGVGRGVSEGVDIPRPSVNVNPVVPQPIPGEAPPPQALVEPPPPPPPQPSDMPPAPPPADMPMGDVRAVPDSDRPTQRPMEGGMQQPVQMQPVQQPDYQQPPPPQQQEQPPPQQNPNPPPNGDYNQQPQIN